MFIDKNENTVKFEGNRKSFDIPVNIADRKRKFVKLMSMPHELEEDEMSKADSR